MNPAHALAMIDKSLRVGYSDSGKAIPNHLGFGNDVAVLELVGFGVHHFRITAG